MNISYANNDKVLVNKIAKHISKIYTETLSPDQIDACYKKVISLLDAIRKDKNEVVERWSEDTVVLITYANTISSKEEKPLKILDKFLSDYCENIISVVHILPFFPSSSDDGFAVIDYYTVDPNFGDWQHIKKISQKFSIMSDMVINHGSSKSQ